MNNKIKITGKILYFKSGIFPIPSLRDGLNENLSELIELCKIFSQKPNEHLISLEIKEDGITYIFKGMIGLIKSFDDGQESKKIFELYKDIIPKLDKLN